MRLTHVRLFVDDYAQMLRFYSETMGFRARLEAPPEDPGYAEFESGPAVVSIYKRDLMHTVMGGGLKGGGGDSSLMVLEVAGVDDEFRRLAGLGVETVTEPHDEVAWVLRVAHLRDPEGNLIEINEPLGSS